MLFKYYSNHFKWNLVFGEMRNTSSISSVTLIGVFRSTVLHRIRQAQGYLGKYMENSANWKGNISVIEDLCMRTHQSRFVYNSHSSCCDFVLVKYGCCKIITLK